MPVSIDFRRIKKSCDCGEQNSKSIMFFMSSAFTRIHCRASLNCNAQEGRYQFVTRCSGSPVRSWAFVNNFYPDFLIKYVEDFRIVLQWLPINFTWLSYRFYCAFVSIFRGPSYSSYGAIVTLKQLV